MGAVWEWLHQRQECEYRKKVAVGSAAKSLRKDGIGVRVVVSVGPKLMRRLFKLDAVDFCFWAVWKWLSLLALEAVAATVLLDEVGASEANLAKGSSKTSDTSTASPSLLVVLVEAQRWVNTPERRTG